MKSKKSARSAKHIHRLHPTRERVSSLRREPVAVPRLSDFDGRRYRFNEPYPIFMTDNSHPVIEVGKVYRARDVLPNSLYWHNPFRVELCIKRKQRREALFKFRKIGKGRKTSRFHKWTELSKIFC